MKRVALGLAAAGLVAVLATHADAVVLPKPPAGPPKPSADAAALAAKADALLAKLWVEQKIAPAAPATDSEFLRRVYLDLAGRIPTVTEARTFLADNGADKRQRLIVELLNRSTYARHMTTVWRHLLVPEADTNQQLAFIAPGFDVWLRQQFAKNAGYDQLVRELLTAKVDGAEQQGFFNPQSMEKLTPIAFYIAKDSKPENLASAAARVFLGLRLECAQCHNHPFATWTRDQFWGLASFFAGLQTRERGPDDFVVLPNKEVLDRREMAIPGTERIVQATFPDGTEPVWKYKAGPRQTLAEWIANKDNPYFAKATVNRLWAHMFGVGIVEPIDEMAGGQDTKIVSAELLDELANAFIAHKYDLKFLFETIANTRAYQLSSRGTGPALLFSRQQLRGLTGEQLYDSLAAATGQPNYSGDSPFGIFFGGGGNRGEFLTKFAQTGKSTEHETSIVQALTLMNGGFVGGATNPTRSELLVAVLEAPFMNEKSRIETLYLAALSRLPTAKELERAQSFVGRATTGDPKTKKKAQAEALADIFWSLINSSEFVFNH